MKKIVITLIALMVAGVSFGDELAVWENDSVTMATSKVADVMADGVESAVMTFGSGLKEVKYANCFGANDKVGWDHYETKVADAVTKNAYFLMSLNFSQSYSLTGLVVQLSAQNSNPTNTVNMTLRSSLTGDTDLDTYEIGVRAAQGAEFATDLSGVEALQSITDVDFYFYVYTPEAGRPSGYAQVGFGHAFQTPEDAETDVGVYGVPATAPVKEEPSEDL